MQAGRRAGDRGVRGLLKRQSPPCRWAFGARHGATASGRRPRPHTFATQTEMKNEFNRLSRAGSVPDSASQAASVVGAAGGRGFIAPSEASERPWRRFFRRRDPEHISEKRGVMGILKLLRAWRENRELTRLRREAERRNRRWASPPFDKTMPLSKEEFERKYHAGRPRFHVRRGHDRHCPILGTVTRVRPTLVERWARNTMPEDSHA